MRIKNLDLFRFLAIVLVIYLHIATRFLSGVVSDMTIIGLGRYGVEMFFVLSGFLITNIYYRKAEKTELLKFWLERFLRTYPPYIVTLLLSFIVVYFKRAQSFDFGYLIFAQNFYIQMPFFMASWSLCVEEHFYLIFPFMILLLNYVLKTKFLKLIFWVSLVIAPSFIRYFYGDYDTHEWGYYKTATIFRFDGISLGCLISFLLHNYNLKLRVNKYVALFFFITFLFYSYYLEDTKSLFLYSFGYLGLIINTGIVLVCFYFADEFYMARFKFVQIGAFMAYSLYLTHNLVLNFIEIVLKKLSIHNPYACTLIATVSVAFVGYIFYHLIEKKSIEIRNMIFNHK